MLRPLPDKAKGSHKIDVDKMRGEALRTGASYVNDL
jgi:hypothetical protein